MSSRHSFSSDSLHPFWINWYSLIVSNVINCTKPQQALIDTTVTILLCIHWCSEAFSQQPTTFNLFLWFIICFLLIAVATGLIFSALASFSIIFSSDHHVCSFLTTLSHDFFCSQLFSNSFMYLHFQDNYFSSGSSLMTISHVHFCHFLNHCVLFDMIHWYYQHFPHIQLTNHHFSLFPFGPSVLFLLFLLIGPFFIIAYFLACLLRQSYWGNFYNRSYRNPYFYL